MGIKVTVNSTPRNRISINNNQRSTIRTVAVAPVVPIDTIDNLVELKDIDASDVDNNETVVYDEVSGKFVIKELPIINGGTF